MRPILTAQEMKSCDSYAMSRPDCSSQMLMERAAQAAMEVLLRTFAPAHVRVICGIGNNGGDGFALARFLRMAGHSADVVAVGDSRRMSVECGRQAVLYAMEDGTTVPAVDAPLPSGESLQGEGLRLILVDALFGIGLDRPIEGDFADALVAINRLRRQNGDSVRVFALDMPSGISDDGRLLGPAGMDGCAVRADATATFAYGKRGMMLYPARQYLGRLSVCDIGITTEGLAQSPAAYEVAEEDVRARMRRTPYSHKGTYGRVAILAGSPGMCGAAILAGRGAYRTGAGLVEIISAEDNRIPLQTALPEAIVTTYPAGICHAGEMRAALGHSLAAADAIVIGCGLGQSQSAAGVMAYVLSYAKAHDLPTVIDADGLNLLAAHSHLWELLPPRTLLTPHRGEMARLCGCGMQDLTLDPIGYAICLCEAHGVCCLCKDAASFAVGGGRVYYPAPGNSGMATAGSGDVLAGILGAVLAYCAGDRPDADLAYLAAVGSTVHAMAGHHAARQWGEHGLMATDLADAVGCVLG